MVEEFSKQQRCAARDSPLPHFGAAHPHKGMHRTSRILLGFLPPIARDALTLACLPTPVSACRV